MGAVLALDRLLETRRVWRGQPRAAFPEVAIFRDSIQASTRGITR